MMIPPQQLPYELVVTSLQLIILLLLLDATVFSDVVNGDLFKTIGFLGGVGVGGGGGGGCC